MVKRKEKKAIKGGMIVMQLDAHNFNFDEIEKDYVAEAIVNKVPIWHAISDMVIYRIVKAVDAHNAQHTDDFVAIDDCHVAFHNRDVEREPLPPYDVRLDDNGKPIAVTPHIHILFGFCHNKEGVATIDRDLFFEYLNLPPNMVELPKNQHWRDAMSAYLIHAKDPQKFQYDAENIYTPKWLNIPIYKDKFSDKIDKWRKVDAKKKTKRKLNDIQLLDIIKTEIAFGRLNLDKILRNPDLMSIYTQYGKSIKTWLANKAEIRALENRDLLEDGIYSKHCIFINGPSGTGKTFATKKIAKKLVEKYKWTVFYSTAGSGKSNPLEGYSGEEICVINDAVVDAFNVAEWHNVLDPHDAQRSHGRYQNVVPCSARIIIVNTTYDLFDFALDLYEYKESEDVNQFIRRFFGGVSIGISGQCEEYTIEKLKRPKILSHAWVGRDKKWELWYDKHLDNLTLNTTDMIANQIDKISAILDAENKAIEEYKNAKIGNDKDKKLTDEDWANIDSQNNQDIFNSFADIL